MSAMSARVHPSDESNGSAKSTRANGSAGEHEAEERKTSARTKNYRVWTADLEPLNACDQFILRQTNMESSGTVPSTFDVCNQTGNLVFKAVENVDPVIRDQHQMRSKTRPPFVLKVLDMGAGKEMLKINTSLGHGVHGGSNYANEAGPVCLRLSTFIPHMQVNEMLVYVKQSLLEEYKCVGIVRRVPNRCCKTPCYFLERPNGSVLLRIRTTSRRGCCVRNKTRGFSIYSSDDITQVGSVHGQTLDIKVDEEHGSYNKSVVKSIFPHDATVTNKALLLAATFMLDYEFFEPGRRPVKKPKISKTCYIIILIIVILIIIGVIAFLLAGSKFQGLSNTGRRPGKPGRGTLG